MIGGQADVIAEAILSGGFCVFLGWTLGKFSAPRSSRAPKPPKPPKAVCGCGHHFALHDPTSNECYGEDEYELSSGEPILDPHGMYVVAHAGAKSEVRRCTCRRYVGPVVAMDAWGVQVPPLIEQHDRELGT